MAHSAERIDRCLSEVLATGTPVTIRRKRLTGSDDLDGIVDQVTADWVVLAALEDTVYPNGFEIIRRKDISRVIPVPTARASYIIRALGNLGRQQTVSPFRIPEGVTTRELLEIVADNNSILGFYIEKDDPDVLFIGRLTKFRTSSFDLAFIDPNGRWEDGVRHWKYRQITRLAFGNRYQRALEKYGDRPPSKLRSAT